MKTNRQTLGRRERIPQVHKTIPDVISRGPEAEPRSGS